MSAPTPRERAQQTRRLLRSEGWAGVVDRLLRRASSLASPPGAARLAVDRDHLLLAGQMLAAGRRPPPPLPSRDGEGLTVAWLCVPPGEGAGGFTNIARLATALEGAGHRCVIYLLDRHGWSLQQHERRIRAWWPSLRAEIRDAGAGLQDAHAIIATSWETAYPALASPARGARLYLVQDHEPSFHPAGSEAMLAEATYRFGFHGLALGRWLQRLLSDRYGMAADRFDFGCELDRYSRDPRADRTAICWYCRPSTPRRAFELAIAALELFAERHPEVEIHLFGEPVRGLPFAARDHGTLAPERLSRLYNRCVAGLVLSATNPSLVPHEMLAAGCVPVVNDAEQNHIALQSPQVVYAAATPFDLAAALSDLVERPVAERRIAAAAAAASVAGMSWADAGETIERVVRRVVAADGHSRPPANATPTGALP